jgi:hypothetical protein
LLTLLNKIKFMKKTFTFILLTIITISTIINCKKKNTNPCDGVTINVVASKTDASAGQNNGSINVTSPSGTGVTFSINGATATSNGSFTGLAAGSYTITAKNANGCSGTATYTIAASDPCAGKTITVTTPTIVGATPCLSTADGSVTVNATGSTGFTYKIGTGAFQSATTFSALAPGSYVVTARDVDGCERTANVTVPAKTSGPLFAAVKSIINAKCVSCHGGSGGVSYNTDCSIVNGWERIKVRCVDGAPSFMPQGGQLPASEKAAITSWVTAGHRITD